MKTVAFVPIKLNSERLTAKNIRPFTNGRPLIYYILKTLLTVDGLDGIYVYCSSLEIKDYLPAGVTFLQRDPYYDLSTTSFNEVLSSFAQLVEADAYVLAHATAPFVSKASIESGISALRSGEHDSALAVHKIQEFLWQDGRPMNYEVESIPRTQDLKPVFVETCGLYVYTRDLIMNQKRRIGSTPYLIEVSKFEATDINVEEDFILADALYQTLFKHQFETDQA